MERHALEYRDGGVGVIRREATTGGKKGMSNITSIMTTLHSGLSLCIAKA